MESDEYASDHSTLLRQFEGAFQTYIIPCYIASGPCAKPGDLKYRSVVLVRMVEKVNSNMICHK